MPLRRRSTIDEVMERLRPPGPFRATTDGALNRRAVSVDCPVCSALPGDACVVDPAERPYPSTMRIGWGDPFHVARSRASDNAAPEGQRNPHGEVEKP